MHAKSSDTILAKREALGLSQQVAATAAGMSISGWQAIERGLSDNPTLETMRGMALALRCEISDIWINTVGGEQK